MTCKFYRQFHELEVSREREKKNQAQLKGFNPDSYVFEPILPNDAIFFPETGGNMFSLHKHKSSKHHDTDASNQDVSIFSDTSELEASIENEGKLKESENDDLMKYYENSSHHKKNGGLKKMQNSVNGGLNIDVNVNIENNNATAPNGGTTSPLQRSNSNVDLSPRKMEADELNEEMRSKSVASN